MDEQIQPELGTPRQTKALAVAPVGEEDTTQVREHTHVRAQAAHEAEAKGRVAKWWRTAKSSGMKGPYVWSSLIFRKPFRFPGSVGNKDLTASEISP